MALEKNQLVEIMNGDGDAEAKAQALMDLMNNNINPILLNKEQILEEKRQENAKRKKAEEDLVALQGKYTELEQRAKANDPGELEKVYQKQLEDANAILQRNKNDYETSLNSYKEQIEGLKKSQKNLNCMQEFNKAIAGKNIDPDAIEDFANYVLGFECSKFDERPIGEGKTILATREGQTIDGAVKAALETNFGKRCVAFGTSGGGAVGAVSKGTTVTNPFKKETFSITEQSRLYMENREEYERLKALANS